MPAIFRLKTPRGFTLLEMMVVLGLSSVLAILGVTVLRHTVSGLSHSSNSLQLEMELGDISDLMGGLLRRSDPRSIVVDSSALGPWSQLVFSSDGHRYRFYGDHEKFSYTVDDRSPKLLSRHLGSVSFAVSRPALPALFTWSVSLTDRPGRPGGSDVTFSATQYLKELPE